MQILINIKHPTLGEYNFKVEGREDCLKFTNYINKINDITCIKFPTFVNEHEIINTVFPGEVLRQSVITSKLIDFKDDS